MEMLPISILLLLEYILTLLHGLAFACENHTDVQEKGIVALFSLFGMSVTDKAALRGYPFTPRYNK